MNQILDYNSDSYAIETFGLTKVFTDWWGRQKALAVDDLNLNVKNNEVFGFLGPNGSGKTTTIKMLLGLLYPTKGSFRILGGDPTDPKVNKRIGFMPEESYLYKYLDARETLDFYGKLFNLPSEVRKIRIEALLDMVGLKAVARRPVGTFSKGMARRIGLAQALINDPDLLILDEPTTGLDPIGTRQIKDLILKLAARGKTILLCSHLLADVEDVCDRIAILYGGKIQTQGHVQNLLQLADKRQITTSHLSDKTMKQIEKLISDETLDYDINSPMEKLETYFVRIVNEAQNKKVQTSGAVTSAHVDNYLTSQSVSESILDKLVNKDIQQPPEKVKKTDQPAAPELPKTDTELLDTLAHKKLDVTVEKIEKIEKTEVVPQQQNNQTDDDILKRLTDNKLPDSEQED